MNKIQNLKLFLALLMSTAVQASFYIEKPNGHGNTTHFHRPAVVAGEVTQAKEYPHKEYLQVTAIPASNYPYMPKRPSKDFLPCDGPVRTLTNHEYKELVEQHGPDNDKKNNLKR